MGDVNGGCVPQTPYTKLKPFFLWDVHGDVHGGMFMGDVYGGCVPQTPYTKLKPFFLWGVHGDVPGLCARAMCQGEGKGYVPGRGQGLCARARARAMCQGYVPITPYTLKLYPFMGCSLYTLYTLYTLHTAFFHSFLCYGHPTPLIEGDVSP
jgi:hypothetical protein